MSCEIRAVQPFDEQQLFELAAHLNTVNLPHDRRAIGELIERSGASFADKIQNPRAREYVFVLEDLEQRRVVGTSMIVAQLGRKEAPYIYFDVHEEEKYSQTLDEHFSHTVLRIGYSYDGPTEIGGLVVDPSYRSRSERFGYAISCVRFLFVSAHRALFRNEMLAELLPPLEPDGRSHLWEALGRHFTRLSYGDADRLSKKNKEFIKSLFPDGDVYATLLPPEARAVIGKVGAQTRGVEKLLRRIGFRYAHRIDPFDGGPHFTAVTDEVTLVAATRTARVGAVAPVVWPAKRHLVAVTQGEAPELRAVLGRAARREDETFVVEPAAAAGLGIEPGSEITVLPLD